MSFDKTGKVSLSQIYTQPDPRAYFETLRHLDYCIPQLAKPYFEALLEAYGEAKPPQAIKVLDIGCSYGINAALLKCDATMDELYERYSDVPNDLDRTALITRDRQLVQRRLRTRNTRFVGLDVSQPALAYALEANWLDDAVCADLERNDITTEQQERLAGLDLIFSTGCVGYITEKTLGRVLKAQQGQRPWMAHFVLRMFPITPIKGLLADLGYETRPVKNFFKQRRFSSEQEQSQILSTLDKVGVDPTGLESQGWLYAQLHISRPRDAAPDPQLEAMFE